MKNTFKLALVATVLASLVGQASFAHNNDDENEGRSSKRASCEIGGVIPVYTALEGKCIDGCKELSLTSGVTDKTVMQVSEHNNSILGYTVKMYSSNSGKLKNQFVGSALIPYTAKYNGVPVALSSAGTTVTNQGPQTTAINLTKDLKISVAAQPASTTLAGYYSDTVTFEISAN